MTKDIKALKTRMENIDRYIVEHFETQMSITELASCEDADFIKACKEWDKCFKALKVLKAI